jgi:hypothetical protein
MKIDIRVTKNLKDILQTLLIMNFDLNIFILCVEIPITLLYIINYSYKSYSISTNISKTD